jgi:hypothetical protein
MKGHLSVQQLTDSGFVEIYRTQPVEQTMDVFISVMEEMKNMLMAEGTIYFTSTNLNTLSVPTATVIGNPRLKTFTLTIIKDNFDPTVL